MAGRSASRSRNRPSEFGGLPGYWANAGQAGFEDRANRGSPVPHLERQALTEVDGGVNVTIEQGTRRTPVVAAVSYGQGGRQVAT